MAQRSSRSKKNQSRKQPELRTGGGRQAKAARSEARAEAVTRTATAGPLVRMRPPGFGGFVFMLILALLGVAAVAAAGARFDQWDTRGFPDSLWLYVAFGMLAAAPALGHIARTRTDVMTWGVLAIALPAGLLVAEIILGPTCPDGGGCGAIGARGALGMFWTIVVLLGIAALTWLLAHLFYARARERRPASGRVRARSTAITVAFMTLFIGGPVAAIAIAIDISARASAEFPTTAISQVQQNCFDLAADPALIARPAPEAMYSGWSTVAVRRAAEARPGIGKAKLPRNWDSLTTVYPYEALVAFSGDGQVAALNCQRISPAAGNAVPDDLKANAPENNPLDPLSTGAQFYPLFYTQGPKEPAPAAAPKATGKPSVKAKAK